MAKPLGVNNLRIFLLNPSKSRLCSRQIVRIQFLILTAGLLAFAALPTRAQVSVWTYHDNNQRTGLNPNETILNLTNVNSTTFGKLFSYAVDGYVYAQPLYVPGLNIAGRGMHNVLFVATEHNTVYAFDADSAGAAGGLLWKTNLGVSAVTTTPTYTNENFGMRYNGAYLDIKPEVGITGTPVIDTNSGTLYVNVFTGVIGGGVTNYFHHLHALNITNGAEQPDSPVLVTASVAGDGVDSVDGVVTFNPKQENQRAALTLAGGMVYLAYTAYADTDPFHGWIIGYNATNLVQLTNYTFNTTPNSTTAAYGANAGEGGIWMSGNGLAVDENTNLFLAVGNGTFNVTNNSGKTEYGDSLMKFSTTNGLAVADYFTPWDQLAMQQDDADLGAGGTIILPDQPGAFPHELIIAGKQAPPGDPPQIYVLNRDQLTTGNDHFDATNVFDFIVQTNQTILGGIGSFDTPAYFDGRIYYGASGDYLKGIALTNGLLSGAGVLTDTARTFSFPGATPSISADGTNSGIVWALAMGTTQLLLACNATNFTTELYNSGQSNRDQLVSGTKFAVPTVADGEVFVGSSNSVSVFGLLAGTFSFSAAAYSVPAANTNLTITVNRVGGTNGAVQVSYATVAGGTAVNGADYTGVSGVLNWTNGESDSKTFTLPVLDNTNVQPDVTVNLALSDPTNAASALGVQPTAVLTVIEPPIDAWKLGYFGANANNPAIAGDAADPEQDGIANLLAYAYAFNPLVVNTNPFTGKLVGKQFQLYFPRNPSAGDLTYLVQASGNLSLWSNLLTFTAATGWVTNTPGVTVAESASNGVPPTQFVTVTATTATNVMLAATNQFLRLQIHR
jgi:hypothetical protein